MLFDLQVIGEVTKQLPESLRAKLPPQHRAGPMRLRDLIAHHHFSLDAEILWDAASRHVPSLLQHAIALRDEAEDEDDSSTSDRQA